MAASLIYRAAEGAESPERDSAAQQAAETPADRTAGTSAADSAAYRTARTAATAADASASRQAEETAARRSAGSSAADSAPHRSARTAVTATDASASLQAEETAARRSAGSSAADSAAHRAARTAAPVSTSAAAPAAIPAATPDIGPIPASDTLHTVPALHVELWRDTTAQAVFGRESVTVAPSRMPAPAAGSLTDNAVFQSFVLLLAAAYALMLYHNLGDVASLMRRITRDTAAGKRLSEEPGGSGFSRFLHVATAIGMLFMGVAAVKYGDSLMPRMLSDTLSHGAVLALSLLATLLCTAVAAFQLAAVRIAGAVTLTQPFVSQLILLKRTYFSLAVILASPALLLFALCPRGTGGVWFVVVAAELTITALLYLWEALNLFISKKISILHWFLYLCTVELFPISLLWLLAVR